MKKIAVTASLAACLVATSYGQGHVSFDNTSQNGGNGAPVFYSDGTTAVPGADPNNGTNYFAQLFAAAGTGVASSSLSAVGIPVNFSDGFGFWQATLGEITTLGQVVNPDITIATTAGGPVTLQVRVWWGGGTTYTTFAQGYAAWQAAVPNADVGWSLVMNMLTTGTPPGTPPSIPVQSFNFQGPLAPVPEPTSLAFAGLGAASLLLLRRRK